ncbi:uncharacterized protein LOC125703030 [Lagopus muta]|uniref:uncharacterized protein LOC125703030 n=1 Tax=Lagopus muta TaxID=64668 RepID=UPI00209FD23C|nr:uncharacterized protein LOC125703030 [Lagopus muta]
MESPSSSGPLGMATQLKLMLQLSLASIVLLPFRQLQNFCRRLRKKRTETSTQMEEGRDAGRKDGAAGIVSPTWEQRLNPDERSMKLLRAPLASMESLGSLAAASASSSFSSLYSFPEPWPGALAELAALVPRTNPEPQPESKAEREEEREPEAEAETQPALSPSPEPPALPAAAPSPLHSLGPSKQISPRDGVQSPTEPKYSHTELIQELLRVIRENQAAVERRCQLLQALLEQQGAAGTPREPPAQEPPAEEPPAEEPPAQEPPSIHLRIQMDVLGTGRWQREELGTVDMDAEVNMPRDVLIDIEDQGSDPKNLDTSIPIEPGRSSPTGSRWCPMGSAHLRAAPRLCRAGQCLQACCSRLWRRLQECWRCCRAQP